MPDAEAFKRLADRGKNNILCLFFECLYLGDFRKCHSIIMIESFGYFPDILSLIMGVGELYCFAAALQITKSDGFSQNLHLPTGIIEIVFTGNLIALSCKEICNTISKYAPPATSYGQRSGWICADIFHDCFLSIADTPFSVFIPVKQHLLD